MSFDFDVENVYMVEFQSGKTIYVSFYEVEDVLEYCEDEYPKEFIKTIYKEVYSNDGENE
jgi:hypothetical protein